MYSEQDLKYAREFREEIHREALEKVRKLYPEAEAVNDRYSVEDYIVQYWDYPGQWYNMTGVPDDAGGRQKLIDTIVSNTVDFIEKNGTVKGENVNNREIGVNGFNSGYDKSFYPDDTFYSLIEKYPECAVDFCIVNYDGSQGGYNAHRRALALACKKLFTDAGEAERTFDLSKAEAKIIDTDSLFSPADNKKLNFRKAFLEPPHKSSFNDKDFEIICSSLFPNGSGSLEVFEWTTDWSDYFDEGREWWGTLCLSVFDKSLERFVIIMASATD